jgi:macrolide-specific efflux system membrane fusion protein
MKWKVLLIVVLLAGGGVAVGASLGLLGASPASASSDYLTAQAAVADVVDEVAATGAVAASASWGLTFGTAAHPVSDAAGNDPGSVTWPVTKVNVAVGDAVKKGQVLASASTAELEAQIADATRAWKNASIQLGQAQDQLDGASGDAATEQAQVGLNNAETAESHAHQALLDLKAQRDLAGLVAPADGIVTAVSITAGADAPSTDAIQLAADPLEVKTSVVESDISSISVGQTASVTVAALGGNPIVGTVASIAPTGSSSGNGGVVSFDVAITLVDPPAGLRSGMTADVTITTASATGVLAIPARALQGTTGAYRVRVLAADGTVSARDVTVGLITSSLVEIKSGLSAGDTVITGTSSSQNSVNGNGGGGRVFGPGGGGGPTTIIKGG